MPEYSVWNPATSSLSASGRSKGVLFVSATPAMKKTRKAIGCEKTYQSPFWDSTISLRESELAMSTTESNASRSGIS